MSAVRKKAVKLTHPPTHSLTQSLVFQCLPFFLVPGIGKFLIDLVQATPSESPTAKDRVFEFPEHILI